MSSWHELTPHQFLALQDILEDADLQNRIESYRDEAENRHSGFGHESSTLNRLADGYEEFEEIRNQLIKIDTPPMILLRLPEER